MKKLILISFVLILASCNSSKDGVKLTGFHPEGNNFWQDQSNKVVHRNQRYAKMEARNSKKEDKQMKRILRAKAKERKRNKRYLAVSFDFH